MGLLEVIARKKILIIFTVFISTLLSILYAQLVTPTYKVVIGFLPPDETSLTAYFPGYTAEILPEDDTPLFYKFLTIVQSYRLQEKVFIEGNFLKRFVDNSSDINGKRDFMEINKSIQISTGRKVKIKMAKNLFSKTIYLEMVGTKPEVISDFLNTLAKSANNEVINNTKETIRRQIKARLNKYSAELKNLRYQDKSKRTDKIRLFSENLKIAKKLGILEKNFSSPTAISSLPFVFDEGQRLPIWWLYGQRALEQEINMLKSRPFTDQNIEGAIELNSKIEEWSRVDLSKINFSAAIISPFSIPPAHPIKPNKILVVVIGVAMGLFVGIVLAFLTNSMAQMREKKKFSSSP